MICCRSPPKGKNIHILAQVRVCIQCWECLYYSPAAKVAAFHAFEPTIAAQCSLVVDRVVEDNVPHPSAQKTIAGERLEDFEVISVE